MTAKQKDIIRKLFDGYNIVGNSGYGFRLRDPKQNVVLSFNYKTFYRIKDILRKHKDYFLVDKNKVRQLHGRSFAKQFYKKQMIKGELCEPCTYQPPVKSVRRKSINRRPMLANDDLNSQLQIF